MPRTRRPPEEGSQLSPREIEVLRLLTLGLKRRAIARQLGIGEKTVDNYVDNATIRLGTRGQGTIGTIVAAVAEGYIRLDRKSRCPTCGQLRSE